CLFKNHLSNVILREGYKTFLNTLCIGDILEEIIQLMKVFHPIIYIVSNYMDSEKDSFLQGFKSQVICTDNKNSSVCENSRYFQQLQGKTTSSCWETPWETSLWLMGFPSVEGILKIGFLNDKVEEQQKHNTDSCDIVLEKDQTLDVVNRLLQHILHCGYWREMEVS
uniref:Uncharacterized protein n=1 Tax=Ursus maritimus TaxID=29073 RepID=A0A452UQ01_URSMA